MITAKGHATLIQMQFGLTKTVTKAIEEAILEYATSVIEEAERVALDEIFAEEARKDAADATSH
jgi:hypothetical protein